MSNSERHQERQKIRAKQKAKESRMGNKRKPIVLREHKRMGNR